MKKFSSSDDGQSLIEYGLILCLVSLLFFAAFTSFGNQADSLINKVADSVSSVS